MLAIAWGLHRKWPADIGNREQAHILQGMQVSGNLLQVATQELLEAFALRISQHVVGVADFFDLTLMQEHHLIRDFAGEAHFVGHQNHRTAFLSQALNHLQHFAHQLGVERRGRLVEQHDFRLHRQRAGNGHPLLLATGEKRRILIGHASRQANLLQVLARAVLGFNF